MVTSTPTGKILRMIVLVALAMIAGGTLYYSLLQELYEALPFAFGVLVTSAFNIFKLKMLERNIHKTLEMDNPDTGKNYIKLQYLLRYFLTAVVLVVIGLLHIYVDSPRIISIWGALFGLFTIQIALLFVRHTKLIEDEPPAEKPDTVADEDTKDIIDKTEQEETEEIVDND